MRRPGLFLGLVLFSLGSSAHAGECHIHPPGSTPAEPRGTIGPLPTLRVCEQERERRFGTLGRCHCVADFTPRWVPRESPPMDPLRPGDLL